MESREPVREMEVRQMLAMIRHRGPDEFGIYLDESVGLGNARLSIIDLSGGQQPISNEDGTMWIVFNGEIFNYVELRPELEARGHRFTTNSDTEVLLHMYEEYGPKCLERLNGQFAFAIWDARAKRFFLARDRLGVRPAFYTRSEGRLIFGSEIKTLLSHRNVRAEIDPVVLDQVFTFWAPLTPRTIFRNIFEIPPGHYLVAERGQTTIQCYWRPEFPSAANGNRPSQEANRSLESYLDEFSELLVDAAKVRLRADVPVGAYLSGGLDSSIIAAVVRNFTNNRLDTFSIAFSDGKYDESGFQQQMAGFLGTTHHIVQATSADIGRVFPDIVWHTEVPLMRTAPAPMFMLSKLVRDTGFKVVLTGEGADEFLAGYDIFKEAKIRRFWARQPDSSFRPALLTRLYPEIKSLAQNNPAVLAAFFRENLTNVDHPGYSHAVRWRNNRRACRFFDAAVSEKIAGRNANPLSDQLHPDFSNWEPLARDQYLEIKIFLSQYLLSSQGDRMGMAHSIEGRFPFLDYRLVEYCNRLPSRLKLRGLTEKYLLKQLGRKWLPEQIWQRRKHPYRAPIHKCFFHADMPDYVLEMLSPSALRNAGLFNPQAVEQLVRKIEHGGQPGESDEMALAGIVSTQLVHHYFVEKFRPAPELRDSESVKICNHTAGAPQPGARRPG